VSFVRGAHHIQTGMGIVRNRKDQNGRSIYDGSVTFKHQRQPEYDQLRAGGCGAGLVPHLSGSAERSAGLLSFLAERIFHSRQLEGDQPVEHRDRIPLRALRPTYAQANNISNFDPALFDPPRR